MTHLRLVPPEPQPLPPLQQFIFAWNGREVFVWWNNEWILARSCAEMANTLATWTARIASEIADEEPELRWPLKEGG